MPEFHFISLASPPNISLHRGLFQQQPSSTNKRILVLKRTIVRQIRMPHKRRFEQRPACALFHTLPFDVLSPADGESRIASILFGHSTRTSSNSINQNQDLSILRSSLTKKQAMRRNRCNHYTAMPVQATHHNTEVELCSETAVESQTQVPRKC